MGKNPLGVVEDPVKAMVIDALGLLGPGFLVKNVEVHWGVDELRIVVELRPRGDEGSVSAWRIVELEDRIMEVLGLEPELSHSRIGVRRDGVLILTYTYRIPGLRPPRAPE